MIVVAAVILVVLATALFWLWKRGVLMEPSLQEGGLALIEEPVESPAKLGLIMFLAVASVLFALLLSAFFMGPEQPQVKPPALLWFNTATLIASSVALGRSRVALSNESRRAGLLLTAFLGVLFLLGQVVAWRQMIDSGNYARTSSAAAFFYLLTGVHALHFFGGVVALTWVFLKGSHDKILAASQEAIDLASLYWNFLLIAWLAVFAALMGWGHQLAVICRNAIT